MFMELRCPENKKKGLSVHYFSLDRPKITKGLMVNLSWKTIKFKQQMEFPGFRIIQDFKKVYMQRIFFGLENTEWHCDRKINQACKWFLYTK